MNCPRHNFRAGLEIIAAVCLLIHLGIPYSSAQVFYRQVIGTDRNLNAVDFVNDSLGIVVGDYGTIGRTTNGGAIWDTVNSGVTRNLNCIRWLSHSSVLVIGDVGTILRSTDTGISWNRISAPVALLLTSCDVFDSLHAVIVGRNELVLLSADGGVSWSIRHQQYGRALLGVSYPDSLHIFASGESGRIIRSTDGGTSWVEGNIGADDLRDIDFIDSDNGITIGADHGFILYSTNGGYYWISRTAGDKHNDIDYYSPSHTVAVGTTAIVSTDGGTSWRTRILPVEGNSVKVLDSVNYLVVGNNGSIYRTVAGIVDLPDPVLRGPPDGSVGVPLSPARGGEFSLTLSWEPYLLYIPDRIRIQISTDSTFGTVSFLDSYYFPESLEDSQKTILHLHPGKKYYWRIGMLFESGLDAWSDVWSFVGSIAESSITIRDIQQVAHDSLALADSVQNESSGGWTLQRSPFFDQTFFVVALCITSSSDLYDPDYLRKGVTEGNFLYCVDTASPGSAWRGLKFSHGWDSSDNNGMENFSRLRRGDLIVCAGRIADDPEENMNSETSFQVSSLIILDSSISVPPPIPSGLDDFYFLSGDDQKIRYSSGEPLEGGLVEFTDLTVSSREHPNSGTINVRSPDGLTMSTSDYSRWMTMRAHRIPASQYEPPPIGRHIDTLRGVITTTSGDYSSWAYPRYRIAPLYPGDIVLGPPSGNFIRGTVFNDIDRDGTWNAGDSGLSDWSVDITGKIDTRIFTNSAGMFSVSDVDSGIYHISIDLPTGWFVSAGGSSQLELTVGIGDTVYLEPVGLFRGWNHISGYVYNDMDEDTTMDPGELGIAGIGVRISGFEKETTYTNSDGFYLFDRVYGGLSDVYCLPPPGWEQIFPWDEGGLRIVFNSSEYNQDRSDQNFSLRECPLRAKTRITVRDNRDDVAIDIYFGVRQGASYGIWGVDSLCTSIDFSEHEMEYPPQVYGLLDGRFVNPHGGATRFGEGSRVDIRDFVSPYQVDTHRITFRPGALLGGGTYPMRFYWSGSEIDSGYRGNVFFVDTLGTILSDMKQSDSLIIADTNITVLEIIATEPVPHITETPTHEIAIPDKIQLFQNYPNPFNPVTTIRYALPRSEKVSVSLFNILGQQVAELVNEVQGPGYKTISFDAGNLPSGIYLYRITAGTFTDVKKMVLLK